MRIAPRLMMLSVTWISISDGAEDAPSASPKMDRRSASRYSSYTSSSSSAPDTLAFLDGRGSCVDFASPSATPSRCFHDMRRLSPPRDPTKTSPSPTRAIQVGCGPEATLLATSRIEPPRSLTSLSVTSSPCRKLTSAIVLSNHATLAHEQSTFQSAFVVSQKVGGMSPSLGDRALPYAVANFRTESDTGSLFGSNSRGGIAPGLARPSLCSTTPVFVCCLMYSTAVPVNTSTPPSGAATTLYASDGSPTASHTLGCFLLSMLMDSAVMDVGVPEMPVVDLNPPESSCKHSSVGSLVPWRNTASRTSRTRPRLST